MAHQTNVVVIMGNLTADPELRTLPSGSSVGKLRVANNRRYKESSSGEWKDRVGYYDVTVWGSMAETCARYLSKGRPVLVTGELRWREWEQEGGGKRQAIDINASQVQFLSSGDGQQQQAQQQVAHPMQQGGNIPLDEAEGRMAPTDVPVPAGEFGTGVPPATPPAVGPGGGSAIDDDIPF